MQTSRMSALIGAAVCWYPLLGCSSSDGSTGGGANPSGAAAAPGYGGAFGSPGGNGPGGSGGVLGTNSGGFPTGSGGLPGTSGAPPVGSGVPPTGSGGVPPIGSGGVPPVGSGGTVGGSGGTVGTGGALPPPTPPGPFCLQQGAGDYAKAGPYTVATMSVDLATALPANTPTPTTYTIFYPQNMEATCPHPIISWGNGTTVTGSQVYAFFNNNAASWGMVVIASDNPNSAGADYLGTGINYLVAQNQVSSSPFYQKLAPLAGTSGHSQGAFAATQATQNQYVKAEVQVEGGGAPKAGTAFLALSGTADTAVTTGPPTQSYGASSGPSMLAIYTGADHTTTPTLAGWVQKNPGTVQFMRFYTAWFRCFLANDATACGMFKGGQSCGVCKDPNWDTIETKNM